MPLPSTLHTGGGKRERQRERSQLAHSQRGRDQGKSSRVLPVVVNVLVGVIHAEGLVDGRALAHEGDGAARVGRDVANGQQPVGGRVVVFF